MRITSSSYYNNIYGENNKLNKQLFDVNKQISSGLKIQYAHENPGIFADTLRLDDEITTLTQVKSSAQNAYKISTQTDTTIGELVKTLESMKVKMLNAATDTNSDASLQAIAKELRGIQNNLLTLANSSIGGQYLFSGTATSVKPIGEDKTYQGNDKNLEAFLGSGIKQKYNISGSQLFLGEESKINRTISTNISQFNLNALHGPSRDTQYISASNTIGDLMGNTVANSTADSHFYVQGTRSDGSTFKSEITMTMSDSMGDLMNKIAMAYDPNQANPTTNQVEVSLNSHGQIEIVDKAMGSSKLDFHMVGAVDFDPAAGDAADISDPLIYAATLGDIDNLQPSLTVPSTSNFEEIIDTSKTLYIKEFTKSGFTPSDSANTLEGINYDRTYFAKDGAKLFSNVSQIVGDTNQFALPSTKISEVSALNSTVLHFEGVQIDGTTPYSVDIDMSVNPVTVNGIALTDGLGNNTAPAEMTYQQLTDVINMAITGQATIQASYQYGQTSLSPDGKIIFEDKTTPTTLASIALYDDSSNLYPASGITNGSALTFNANNALMIRDPKMDFFAQIEEIIRSVEEGKKFSNGLDGSNPRNVGVENSIQKLDDMMDHVSRLQAEAGSYSQVLEASSERTDMLIISTKTLQSDIIDTDIAEATLRMQQLRLNYQAMLSSISKVSQLSLVNYL